MNSHWGGSLAVGWTHRRVRQLGRRKPHALPHALKSIYTQPPPALPQFLVFLFLIYSPNRYHKPVVWGRMDTFMTRISALIFQPVWGSGSYLLFGVCVWSEGWRHGKGKENGRSYCQGALRTAFPLNRASCGEQEFPQEDLPGVDSLSSEKDQPTVNKAPSLLQ